MPNRRGIGAGVNIRPTADIFKSIVMNFVTGAVATDGVRYSPVVTFGTTEASIFSKTIDPGFDMALKNIDVGFTQKFTEVANAVGSLFYYWRVRSNSGGTQLGWVNITGTYSKGIGSKANSEDTFSGYLDTGSLPEAPLDIELRARGLIASTMTGEVKNSSRIALVGVIIPGT